MSSLPTPPRSTTQILNSEPLHTKKEVDLMLYTVNDKEYSSDSTPNQRILDQLINREVF